MISSLLQTTLAGGGAGAPGRDGGDPEVDAVETALLEICD